MKPALNRRIAGATTVAAMALGGTFAAGALSPAAAVTPIPQGSITGTITGPTGVAIPGAYVNINGDTDNDGVYDDYNVGQYTGTAGDYNLDHLPAGSYRLGFSANGYVYEYYNNVDDPDAATPVAVGAGNVPVPAVSLAADTYLVAVDADTDITGLVTDAATGKPIVGADVTAYDATTGDYLEGTDTDVTGRYEFDGLEASGPVKVEFDHYAGGAALRYRTAWSGGARSEAAAAPVTITPGTPVTVSSALTQYAGITGKVLNPAGVAPYDGSVAAYDADSNVVEYADLRPDGTYYLGDLNPGEEYRVVFSGAYDYPSNDEDNPSYYYDVWYKDGNSFSSATPLTAGASGAWTSGIGATLRNTLVALELPSVSGQFVIGKTLTGNKGRWNRNGNSTFGYEWLRGATVVGTASTYKLTAADAGQSIALRVTNTNFDMDQPRTVSATTKATVAKYKSAIKAKAKKVKKGKKAGATQVTITVKASGQSAKKITGKVKVTEGKKKVATAKVKKGKATFVLKSKFAKAGKHTYTVKYNGNKTTLSVKDKVKVKIKK